MTQYPPKADSRPEAELKLYQTVLSRGFPPRKPATQRAAAATPSEQAVRPAPARVTAAVIVRNEAHLLEGCLAGVAWCDEIIVLDMGSRDGSAELARAMGATVYEIEPFAIAEPARIKAAELARNDWVLLIDPDEHMPAALADHIQQAIRTRPQAGAMLLPWQFYFKGEALAGTVWGGSRKSKWCLIHRGRVELLGQCNRFGRVLAGFEEVTIEGREDNTIRHYWAESYWVLLYKHLVRYARLEAAKMHADGQRWSWRLAVGHPWREFMKSLRHMDGWRMGLRGWALSLIYLVYTAAYVWLLPLYTAGVLHAPRVALPTARMIDEGARPRGEAVDRAA